ncbi:MAG: undecaprenyl-diphosphate phosphatase [Gammaproteobacteria bacterium]
MDNWGRWAEILLLGAVEGATEFLPVSSTGHLIAVSHMLGRTEDADKLFEVVIQLGAVCAVLYEYRRRLWDMARAPGSAAARRVIINLTLAFLPAAVLGFLFYPFIKEYLFSPKTVAAALIIGGAAIILAEKKKPPPRILTMDDMRARDALAVGFCQTLALVPGVSRAGATIIGAMLWGVERRAATEFSFLLALPVMFAASGYDLLKNRHLLNFDLGAEIAAGFIVSFFAALIAVRFLLRYVSRHDFTPFGWYRIAAGTAMLAAFY